MTIGLPRSTVVRTHSITLSLFFYTPTRFLVRLVRGVQVDHGVSLFTRAGANTRDLPPRQMCGKSVSYSLRVTCKTKTKKGSSAERRGNTKTNEFDNRERSTVSADGRRREREVTPVATTAVGPEPENSTYDKICTYYLKR